MIKKYMQERVYMYVHVYCINGVSSMYKLIYQTSFYMLIYRSSMNKAIKMHLHCMKLGNAINTMYWCCDTSIIVENLTIPFLMMFRIPNTLLLFIRTFFPIFLCRIKLISLFLMYSLPEAL